MKNFSVANIRKLIRKFLTLVDYRKFIKIFGKIITSLTHLVEKDIAFNWTDK